MNIFILRVFSLENSFGMNRSYPASLYESNSWLGFGEYFSSKEKALENMKKKYQELDEEDKNHIVYFTIEERVVDSGVWVETLFYKPTGEEMMRLWDGDDVIENLNPQYQKYDYVMFIYNQALCVGQVIEVPVKNDNTYYLAFHDPRNPQDTQPHSHAFEGSILKKIKNEEIDQYFSAAALEHLKQYQK